LALIDAQAALEAKDLSAAVAAFARASAAGASLRLTARSHALALSELGQHQDAVEVFKPWFGKNQKDSDIANLMGVLLKRAGKLEAAAQAFETARKLRPSAMSPWQNLGNVYDALGNAQKAALYFRGALKLDPKSAELHRLLARALLALGQRDAAIDHLRRAVLLAPSDTGLAAMLVNALAQAGQFDAAQDALLRAKGNLNAGATSAADFAVIEARLAFRMGQSAAALAILRDVLSHAPGHLNANVLFATLIGETDREAANIALERAVAQHPNSFEALERLVESLSRSRYGSEAAHIERAYQLSKTLMAQFPDRIKHAARTLRTILLRVLDEDRFAQTGTLRDLLPDWQQRGLHSFVHYELGQVSSLQDRLALMDWHCEWGRRVSADIAPIAPLAQPSLVLGRKLRIGFMSSDLRNHPITYFALPLLEGYNRDTTEVFCYSFDEKDPDRVQTHLQGQVTCFHKWPGRSDAQVAQGIAADGLDILFELGGSTAMNKLNVMAYRPARLGASWLGYPHSAGLAQIDYILTDPFLRPDDPRLLLERAFEMPQTWVSLSRMFAPHEIAEGTPQTRKGHLTFGTANNPYKYTPACLDAWAEVLRAVPDARFLFLRPEGGVDSFVQGARTAFARRDVDPDRLDFVGVRGDHMRYYNEIDICLDSLPHVGGTTTCEALWMGVPTISLVGPGFPERLSYSNLSNAGLGDLAVFSRAAYVTAAAALAADPARRLALRHGMRAQIAANPLGQPQRFTQDFYDLARKVAAQ
jgi:predicted O-linked N-acetylglucosamine transferase (SPINDLY family)